MASTCARLSQAHARTLMALTQSAVTRVLRGNLAPTCQWRLTPVKRRHVEAASAPSVRPLKSHFLASISLSLPIKLSEVRICRATCNQLVYKPLEAWLEQITPLLPIHRESWLLANALESIHDGLPPIRSIQLSGGTLMLAALLSGEKRPGFDRLLP